MKKVKRIFFVFYIVGLFCVGAFIIHEEVSRVGFWTRIQQTPSLLLPMAWTILSLPSLFFNLEKLGESRTKSKIYKFTRISDLVFSIYMIPLIIVGIFSFIGFRAEESGSNQLSFYQEVLPIIVMIGCLISSVLLFIDNIKFHKSFRNLPIGESIDDIGKTNLSN